MKTIIKILLFGSVIALAIISGTLTGISSSISTFNTKVLPFLSPEFIFIFVLFGLMLTLIFIDKIKE